MTVSAVHKPCGEVLLVMDYVPRAGELLLPAGARYADGRPLLAADVIVCPHCERPVVWSELGTWAPATFTSYAEIEGSARAGAPRTEEGPDE